MTYLITIVFLVLTTFLTMNIGDQIRLPKEIMCVFGFFVLIWSLFRYSGIKNTKPNKWIFLFLGWCLFDSIWIAYKHLPPNTMEQMMFIGTSSRVLLYVTLASVAILLLSKAKNIFATSTWISSFRVTPIKVNIKHQAAKVVRFIALLGLIVGCYTLFVQVPGFDQYLRVLGQTELGGGSFAHRVVGVLGNPSVMAMWFAIVLPCLIYSKRWIGFVVVCICILLEAGKTGIAAGVISTMFYLFFAHRKVFLGIIVAMFVTTLFFQFVVKYDVIDSTKRYVQHFVNDDEGRFIVWRETIKDFKRFPLTGHGLGSYSFVEAPRLVKFFTFVKPTMWRHPHNEYINILFEAGIPGLFLFLMIFVDLFRRFIFMKKPRILVVLMSMLVAISIDAVGVFPFQIGTIAFLSVLVLGLTLNIMEEEECLKELR